MHCRPLPLFAAAAGCLAVAAAQNTVSLAITPQPTAGASGIVSPSFAGFGIEPSNLFSFTGGNESNALTYNLLGNLANYTGTPPHLRIGGNTQDYFIYDPAQNEYAWVENPHAVGQGAFPTDHMIIGPRFFEVIDRFPSNTPITFGLNLAYSEADYIERITTMATQALQRLANVNLVSFEIGNEPDLYLQNGFRTGNWGGQVYTQEWLTRAAAIWEQVLQPQGRPSTFFEPGTTASTIGTTFQIDQLDEFGITVRANGSTDSYVATWNQHDYYYYIGVSTYPLTQDRFMTLSTTNDQFAAWVTQIQQAFDTPFPYALREMGVVGPIGMAGVTDVFGAALWTLNFLCYAATLNISSVQLHMTDNSNASAWQPIEIYGNAPYVRPNYYGLAAFAQAIGPTCQAQIGGYIVDDLPDNYGGRIGAYSIYQGGTLGAVVLINSNPANVSQAQKATLTFELSLGRQFAGQDLYLAYLTGDGADATHGTTFNGISYEQSGDGRPTPVDDAVQVVKIGDDGTVQVPVRDTQAVVANIGGPVGQRPHDRSACSALASSTPDAKPVSTSSGTSAGASSSHTNAASSTGRRPSDSATSRATRIANLIFSTLGVALLSGFSLVWL